MADMISSFLNPGKAYDMAGREMQSGFDQAKGIMNPYVQQGQDAYGGYQNAMQSLLNPQQLQSDWMSGYEQSPYAQHMAAEATNQGLNAASSMGLMGSTPALQAIQGGTSRIMAGDRDNYLNQLMQKYLAGAGMAQNLYGTGAQMGGQLGQMTQQHGQQMGEMAYGKQAAPGQLFGQMLGTAAGFALGGPIGGALATKYIGPHGMGGKP